MSRYQLQKLCRAVNREPAARARYLEDREGFIAEFELSAPEKRAVIELDIDKLYDFGVHPLLLRPFTIINGVSQDDYIAALNPEA